MLQENPRDVVQKKLARKFQQRRDLFLESRYCLFPKYKIVMMCILFREKVVSLHVELLYKGMHKAYNTKR